jgi:hypothetical protein
VAGLKSIFENYKGDKKLLAALKPLMKKTFATLKAINHALEAVANLTDSKAAQDASGFLADLQRYDTAWHMKGLFQSFNLVLNVRP